MAKRQKHPFLRLPRLDATMTPDLLVRLYTCVWNEWQRDFEAARSAPSTATLRLTRQAIDISPLHPDARHHKGSLALDLLEQKRLDYGPRCLIEQLAMSALTDFLGRR